MARQSETKYIVGDGGYLLKGGKVYKTGEEISLTAEEHKNVEDKVVSLSSDQGKQLQQQTEGTKTENDKE